VNLTCWRKNDSTLFESLPLGKCLNRDLSKCAFQVSAADSGWHLADEVAVRFAERVQTLAAKLSWADQRRLSQLASRIVAADAKARRHRPIRRRRSPA
jgi:uncharacterized protein YfaP (DUF2135 family)